MKKKHNLFIETTEPGRPGTNYRHWIQDHKKMNSKIVGDVEKRLRKIYSQQVEVKRQKAFASWSEIKNNTQDRESLPKLHLCSFLYSKNEEIIGISECRVGLINSQK